MNQAHHLDSEQHRTLRKLLGHPLPANMKWPQALALLEALGEVTGESKDRYRVTIDGRTEVFQPPHHGDIPVDLIVKLRHFLAPTQLEAKASDSGLHLLLVVDHHSATIYKFEPGSERVGAVVPYDPEGYLRHLHHVEGHYQGQRAPEDPAYYLAIANALQGAETIVIFGHGDGHSEAAELVCERLRDHLPNPAPRLLVNAHVDAGALTEPQLLAAARHLLQETDSR